MRGLVESCHTCEHDATHPRFATVPSTSVRLLTKTSKMPGPSWSLPAHKSCPRANGTICDNCYAGRGCYRYSNTRNAQNARFAWTVESMRTAAGRTQWIATMVHAIRAAGCRYFRVHDSGDLFSDAYAQCWFEVCRQLPEIRFWIPTRAWQQPAGPLPVFDPLLMTLRKLAALSNVTVRPSALNFGDAAPNVAGLHASSTAALMNLGNVRQCPASNQGGRCGDCRTCWDMKETAVSYRRH
jgi:hypothetical protein